MSYTTSSSNLTSGFIDIATFDELDKYLYKGNRAVSYLVRRIQKSTWFTVVPVILSKCSGQAQFAQQWSVNISRAGDYLLRAFLRVTLPEVYLNASGNRFGANGSIRWCRNFMHSLIREATISFNDLIAMRFDNYYLDFWSQFTIPAGKKNGYYNMIGNIEELNNPLIIGGSQTYLPSVTLNLPLPFFFDRNTGVSLPTASLPYNDMKLNFNFRDWRELLILDNISTGVSVPAFDSDLTGTLPQFQTVDVWAEYAIVDNDERATMADVPRDILIEQVQTIPTTSFNAANSSVSTDIRLSHAIKTLFFAVRNKTNWAEWANYTSASPVAGPGGVTFSTGGAADPIARTSLLYESTQRLSNMGADYFSLVSPWYNAVSIPTETGYHMYTYSLNMMSIDPMGSTNYGKLSNVSMQTIPSAMAQRGSTTVGSMSAPSAGATDKADGFLLTQVYDFILCAVNNNIVRIAGGTLGFPVL